MNLPAPTLDGKVSLERTLSVRRTVRSFLPKPMDPNQLSQLLWAAYGTTDESRFKKTTPSAGALFPMDVYAVVGEGGVEGLEAGIYHYTPEHHDISLTLGGEFRAGIAKASLRQRWMEEAPLYLVATVEYRRICGKYGDRGIRYAMMEAGHIGQNIFLQAEALGLGAGIVGAFHDEDVGKVMKLPTRHEPLLIMPVGYKR